MRDWNLDEGSVLIYVELTLHLVDLGPGELRFVLSELRLRLWEPPPGLIERRSEGPRIALKEQLALPHERPFLVVLLDQVPGDLRFDVCVTSPSSLPIHSP